MAARTWFKPENTSGLSAADLAILNRAVRLVFSTTAPPGREALAAFRSLYKPGMSAKDLAEAFEAEV